MAATCGYICPQCNGTGSNPESLEACSWCQKDEISDKDWIQSVHERACCSDIGIENETVNKYKND